MKNFNGTIGEIVAEDFRTAAVFSNYKIDFCCKGNRTIEQACNNKSINIEELKRKLNEALSEDNTNEDVNYQSWPLNLLADYIEKTHHKYIREKIPPLTQFLTKVQKVHGERHPELLEVFDLFSKSANDLLSHLQKEEMVLFPFIRNMTQAEASKTQLNPAHFGSVENPVRMMMDDHAIEGERFQKISELTKGYTPPPEACNTYKVSFAMLDEFEQNLHKHIHLENNILFPKAIIMEKSLQ